ncbi:Ig-like domain-containing protein [Photobacterium sp. SDRW27]|uniref:cytochrome c peroxidase n=1 Tax=Photobacterium obscurum TaxID=2829490 RepID=UPI0022430E73|nr:cytochrome c peroxidase [Photobacterium obscurum]MCW8327707.1 Ig-like domain-containing protein [Photobacterium obscurum]
MKYKYTLKRHHLGVLITAGCIFGLSNSLVYAEAEPVEPPSIGSLKGIQPAPVPGLEEYVKNKKAAIKLGKALFWDMQVGSQGQSCGSCHFNAGADSRQKNQLSPSLNHTDPLFQGKFDPTLSGGAGGPNYTLTASDFPFRKYENPDDRKSTVLFDSNDVTSSQGVFASTFTDLSGNEYPPEFNDGKENCTTDADIFNVVHIATRKVEPRNTPTVINAIFNFRNFWDGRANNTFNGVDPFGLRNKDAHVLRYDIKTNKLIPKKVALINSSAASQAVGPVTSPFEMTCDGKSFQMMAKKLLDLKPLALQQVDRSDSQLGLISAHPSNGLIPTYRTMVMDAFNNEYWMSPQMSDGFTQIENNFSLFWGLAIQLYESTLISDDSRFDRYMDGDSTALTASELRGMGIFLGKGKCANCHSGPEFSKAATHLIGEEEEEGLVERMVMSDNHIALYDNGFYNIGVRPTKEDIGVGGEDPWGNPLSFTQQAKDIAAGKNAPDNFEVDPSTFEENPEDPVDPYERDAVFGAFKVPGLRNVELTGPYMHNGGMSSLIQVVNFYNRGGNRTGDSSSDSTGFDGNNTTSNLDPDIRSLGLTEDEKHDLVAFMKSLTDERVRWEKAPFDRPQLFVPVGGIGDEFTVQDDGSGRSIEKWLELPAIGANGRSAKNLPAIQPFLNGGEIDETSGPVEAAEAVDDSVSGSYRRPIAIDVLANDQAGTYPIDPSSVIIVSQPNSRNGSLTDNGDGTFSYRAFRVTDNSFSYQVTDENGMLSNVATVTIGVTF